MHTEVYTGSLLNQELHPVFRETTGESTKQSTLDYLQHHQRSDLDPLKTHISFGSAQTPVRMLILTTSRTHNTSQLHTQSFFKVQRITLVTERSEINTRWKFYFTLSWFKQTQSKLQLFKSKISEKLKYVFLWLNLSSCLLHKLNKLFIAFKDWSKHLKLERNQL